MKTQSERWFEIVGQHLKKFVRDKFPTQKEASKHLGISETALSRLMTGVRLPSRVLTLKIIKLGFDKRYFDEFESLDEVRADDLSKEDLIDLLKERRIFSKQQSDMIDFLLERVNKFQNREEQLNAEVRRLQKELTNKT